MPRKHPLAEVTDRCRQLLHDQIITIDGPGTLLRDVQLLIDAIGTPGVATQSNRGNLPSHVLPNLNARLSDPLEIPLKRPLLRDYPNVAGIFVLLRVMDLVRADASRVWIDAEQLATWNGLNPTERYFALLEAWLFEADGQVLGGESRRELDDVSHTFSFLADTLSARWKSFDEAVHKYAFRGGGVSTWNVQLMARLGLIEVVPSPLEGRNPHGGSRGWLMGKGRRTPWGEAVAWALREHFLAQVEHEDDLLWFRPEEPDGPGVMQPIFQPFFPEYQRLFVPPPPPLLPGVYVFKVGFKPRYGPPSVWRRLAVPDDTTLYGVGAEVLKAFKFWDDDHLHLFRYRDRTGRERVFHHSYSEEEPCSEAISVGELDLPVKQTLEFVFDFGSTWKFLLKLERIDPPDPKLKRPEVIESAGEAPKQYEGVD